MKLIICLLSALLLISCVAQNNNNAPYVKVSQQEIISSSLINELMGFGLDYNFAKAHQKYGISANNVAVTKINSVYRQVLRNNKVNYKFDVEATNNNDATMNATYTIEYNTKTGNKIVRQWNYHINYSSKDTEQEVDASYALCSEDEILNNTVIVSLLKYGVAYVFEKASEKYGVSDDNVVVYQIDSVEKQDLKTKVNYRFYLHAHNNDGAKMKTNFTIEYRPKTEKKIVRKWWYYVQWKDNTDDVEDEVENEVEPDNEEECVLSLEELDFCEIAEEGTVIGTENVEANLEVSIDVEIELDVDVETTVDDTEYHKVSEKEIQTNAVINECLGVGLDYVWNKAAQKYGVSDDNTQVTQINSVYRQNLKSKTNYKFEIAATNNDDATMTASFTIEYNNQSGQEIVRQWSYSINYQN